MSKYLIFAAFLFSAAGFTSTAEEAPYPGGLAEAVIQIESLDAMRSGLAGTFGEKGVPADEETFVQVCKPVGMKAKQIAKTRAE